VKRKPDYSRMVTLDYSPSEALLLVGVLKGVRELRGDALGPAILELIDGTEGRIHLQLRRLNWPQGHNQTPYPV
jgi:hypothetical protein